MMLPSLVLRSVNGDMVVARRRLGRGLRMPFHVSGQRGELLLEPASAPAGVTPMLFETACGVMALSEPSPQLSLLGDCPMTIAQAANDPDSWFWAFFEHHLSAQVRDLLGYLRVALDAQLPDFGCRLSVSRGESRVMGYLWLSPESFMTLCDAGPWLPTAEPIPKRFQLSIAVTVGSVQLPVNQLRTLRPGDVLVLEQVFFHAQGEGCLQVGRHRLQGHIDDETGQMRLTLTSIEEISVDEQLSAQHSFDQEHEPVTDVFGHEPFDELSITLSVRCGALNLTLGELRNLAPGSVLGIGGYAPGTAGLYYGDRPIGQGQLVEVDGRLGLQVSRVIFSR